MASTTITWFGLGDLMGMFVLVGLRKNVKVIQAEKDALLLKF